MIDKLSVKLSAVNSWLLL